MAHDRRRIGELRFGDPLRHGNAASSISAAQLVRSMAVIMRNTGRRTSGSVGSMQLHVDAPRRRPGRIGVDREFAGVALGEVLHAAIGPAGPKSIPA